MLVDIIDLNVPIYHNSERGRFVSDPFLHFDFYRLGELSLIGFFSFSFFFDEKVNKE